MKEIIIMICIFSSGHEIAPNTGTSVTKFFTLATKSWKLIAKLATSMFHHNLTERCSELKDLQNISMANFLVKFVSKTQHMHLNRWLDTSLNLGELECCISSILVFTLLHVKDLFPNLILESLSWTLTV